MGIKRGSSGHDEVTFNKSVFDMALTNQKQHADLGARENRNKHNTGLTWPWRYKNDQCAFGVALADREQHIVFDWPWRENNAQSVFGVALVNQYVCLRKCMQQCTLAPQVRGKARGASGK